jgi:hypothetical protein
VSWRSVALLKGPALLAVASLLAASEVLAGGGVRTGAGWSSPQLSGSPSRQSQPVPAAQARIGQQPVTVAVGVAAAPSQPATESAYVNLRGPDGQVRRFPLEGGRAAIRPSQVIIYAGQSVTIQWVAAK